MKYLDSYSNILFYFTINNIKQAVQSFNNKSTAIVIVTSIHIIKIKDSEIFTMLNPVDLLLNTLYKYFYLLFYPITNKSIYILQSQMVLS